MIIMAEHSVRRLMKSITLIAAICMLSGCKLTLFDPVGVVAREQRELITIAIILMLCVVVPVIILTLVFTWKYRSSNKSSKYTPNWAHNNWLEFVWWAIPCIIIIVLATITWISSHTLDPYRPIEAKSGKKPINVEVVSLDWKWLFIYPDLNIATVNYLEVPVNTPVAFKLTSDAPMNSFWIPQIGSQIMTMPGMQTKLHMLADTVGTYKGQSANFSGDGFSGMHFDIKVSGDEDFTAWVKKAQHSPNHLTKAVYDELAKPSEYLPVTLYSSVNKGLFSQVIMKYMKPEKNTKNG